MACSSSGLGGFVAIRRPGALGLKLVRPVMGVATYPGRVRDGDIPSAQLGGIWGSAVSSTIGVWGGAREANAILRRKTQKSTQKSGGQEAFYAYRLYAYKLQQSG